MKHEMVNEVMSFLFMVDSNDFFMNNERTVLVYISIIY